MQAWYVGLFLTCRVDAATSSKAGDTIWECGHELDCISWPLMVTTMEDKPTEAIPAGSLAALAALLAIVRPGLPAESWLCCKTESSTLGASATIRPSERACKRKGLKARASEERLQKKKTER